MKIYLIYLEALYLFKKWYIKKILIRDAASLLVLLDFSKDEISFI